MLCLRRSTSPGVFAPSPREALICPAKTTGAADSTFNPSLGASRAIGCAADGEVAEIQRPRAVVDRNYEPGEVNPLLAHEFAHAIQDAQFGIDSIWENVETEDQSVAARSTIEGDAQYVEWSWYFDADLIDPALVRWNAIHEDGKSWLLARVRDPGVRFIDTVSSFPYVYGFEFATGARLADGLQARRTIWASPPRSTAAIMKGYRAFNDGGTNLGPPFMFAHPSPAAGYELFGETPLGMWYLYAVSAVVGRGFQDGFVILCCLAEESMGHSKFWFAALALCVACADTGGGAAGGGGNGAGASGGLGGTGASGGVAGGGGTFVPEGSYQVKWGPVEVPAGRESTQCMIKRVGNTGRINVHEVHNVLGATSHHFIVYRVNDTVERPAPFGCTPFIDTLNPEEGAPIMITQKPDDRLTLPQGVAYVLEPNQMVRLELHYINVSAAPQMAEATSTFIPIPDEEFEHEADILFMGTGDIDLPPREQTTGPTVFLRPPSVLDGANFFAITGHEHQHGTNVQVDVAPTADGPSTPVYQIENFLWDEPETISYDPPFQLPSGGGFNITCDWNNTSDDTVNFGTGVDDEMCFFWAYYYPSQGSVVCVDEVFGFSFCCPGSPECSFL